PYYDEWVAHPFYDDYWRDVDAALHADQIRVPCLNVAGWYDIFMPGQLALDRALASHADERVRESSRFVIGPWSHSSYLGTRPTPIGKRNFGAIADSSAGMMTPLALDWFDCWLKPGGGYSELPRVRYFSIGGNRWVDSEQWPPLSTPLRLYLHSG